MDFPTSTQGLNCSVGSFPNTVANTTTSRVCGLDRNRSVVESCCDGAEVKDSDCQFYCSYPGSISEWVTCIANNDFTFGPPSNAFCMGGTVSNVTETLPQTSFAFQQHTLSKTSWLIFTLLFSAFFITPTSAAVVQSLNPHPLPKRQSTSNNDCTLSIARNFTRSANSQRVSQDIECQVGDFCAQVTPIETALDQNNRTINSTSAAAADYDTFFDILSNVTSGRAYPAMSSLNTTFEFAVPNQSNVRYSLVWTPFSFCVNGTMTNCAGTVGDSDAELPFEACGPMFAGDVNPEEDENAVLLGGINYVTEGGSPNVSLMGPHQVYGSIAMSIGIAVGSVSRSINFCKKQETTFSEVEEESATQWTVSL